MADKEYFDTLREDGTVRGGIKLRTRVHKDGDWHRTVHVWIHNSKGEVLIQKRSSKKETYPDLWDVSCAGHVSAGDNSRNAAVREAQEELGLSLSPLELHKLCTVRQSYHHEDIHDNEVVDVYVVLRDVAIANLVLQEEEVANVRYINAQFLRECIQADDPSFVPHPEEYRTLLAYFARAAVI